MQNRCVQPYADFVLCTFRKEGKKILAIKIKSISLRHRMAVGAYRKVAHN